MQVLEYPATATITCRSWFQTPNATTANENECFAGMLQSTGGEIVPFRCVLWVPEPRAR